MDTAGSSAVAEKNDRLNMRVPAVWLARVKAAAERKGLDLSSYVRMVITERMEADGPPPDPKPKRPRPSA